MPSNSLEWVEFLREYVADNGDCLADTLVKVAPMSLPDESHKYSDIQYKTSLQRLLSDVETAVLSSKKSTVEEQTGKGEVFMFVVNKVAAPLGVAVKSALNFSGANTVRPGLTFDHLRSELSNQLGRMLADPTQRALLVAKPVAKPAERKEFGSGGGGDAKPRDRTHGAPAAASAVAAPAAAAPAAVASTAAAPAAAGATGHGWSRGAGAGTYVESRICANCNTEGHILKNCHRPCRHGATCRRGALCGLASTHPKTK